MDKVSWTKWACNYKPVTGLAHQACSEKIVWSLKPECSNRGSALTSWPWIHAQKSARNSRNKHRTELRGVFQTGTRFNLRHCLCKHRWLKERPCLAKFNSRLLDLLPIIGISSCSFYIQAFWSKIYMQSWPRSKFMQTWGASWDTIPYISRTGIE